MARTPLTHPESTVAPKEFILPGNWDKELKKEFTQEQKTEIEYIVYCFIERHHFDERRLNFDEVEHRFSQIIDGASEILKGYPYPHTHYSSDGVHMFVEQKLSRKLMELNGPQLDTPSLIMHQVLDLKEAASAVLSDLREGRPKRLDGRPSDKNADRLIYDLGKCFKEVGGNFTMPKSPSLTHPFYSFLQAINEHIPEDLRLSESDLINRSIKVIRKIKELKKLSEK